MSPHAGVAIGLELLSYRERVGLAFAASLPGCLQSIGDARQRLHVVTDLVGNDVGLREISRRAEAFVELLEEGEIEVDLAIRRAIKGSHCGLPEPACRPGGTREQHEDGRLVL